ncbi:MAG: 3-phenylpropionate/trans-cinnamate dioxygenase ferredoxin subunit [Candidatus Kentron sp. G]|nr:MAG: 3-phenylpropionate/trans-cinnamate dioxygenase ferredoxin subunit [Candidatus Kentron sp. G]VFN00892.1 MAG: 3-phenylpropionate/trans-cinnamate dioxygenase ferredoxin subunit [Candidatus Kentron sp. G]VFN02861.1 MAG: 3-phenylpropionate/trans-cinnamate dioxygenase ferredoxin subunit [Candidatus Kentron sp. G]
MTKWIDIAKVGEFAPNTARAVTVEGTKIAVFNLNGEFYAMEDVCTHDNKPLTGGRIDGDQVICPRHGARFDIKTGEASSAPAYEPVDTFAVRVENDKVQVAFTDE